MRRDIKKQFWFNEKEAGALEEKANDTCPKPGDLPMVRLKWK